MSSGSCWPSRSPSAKRQIEAFRELFEEGNSREVQPLNGRKVLSDTDDGFEDDD